MSRKSLSKSKYMTKLYKTNIIAENLHKPQFGFIRRLREALEKESVFLLDIVSTVVTYICFSPICN